MNEQKEELPIKETQQKLNIFAVLGFVFGCMNLLMGLFALPAIILSVIGLVQISNTNERGKGFAIAGIILGAVLPVLTFLLFMVNFQA